MKKRIAAMILAVLMVMALVGCGNKVDTSKYGTTEVMKIGSQSVYLDELNYYLRTNQYELEVDGYLTENGVKKWDQEINYYNIIIFTLKEELLFSSVSELRQVYVLCDQAAKQNVTLTAEEQEKVKAAAKDFLANSDADLLEYVELSEERLVEILMRNALANKMYEAIIADADTTVTTEEAKKYDVTTVFISKEKLSKIKDLDKDATPETVAKEIADRVNGGEKLADVLKDYDGQLTTTANTMADGEYETTFGKIVPDMKVGEAKTTKYSTTTSYYVVVRDNDFNEEATEKNKVTLAEKKLAEHFSKQYTEWEKAMAFEPEYKMIEKLPVSEPIYAKALETTTAAGTTGAETTEGAEETTEGVEETTEGVEETEAETK